MRIILIDNYDSFTWNIVHYLEQCDCLVDVVKNDVGDMPDWGKYAGCVISPGPGLPQDAGHLMGWLKEIPSGLPVLGICLGLQSLVVHTGGELRNLHQPLHGKMGFAIKTGKGKLWQSMPERMAVAHYHSWVADEDRLPQQWRIGFVSDDQLILAIEHESKPWSAVQFHPESILSQDGIRWFQLWLASF